ncbi:MAG: hydantoinase/oxoprolinase family protein, partial [Candidatus Desulforudis sp.]|nr:hydantoinase/oxoprolinase family protein [Desulforudis sp.]
GPLHAVELARELSIPRILVPPYPGVTSAWGMLSADVRHDYSLSHVAELSPVACAEINRKYAQLAGEGRAALAREGFAEPAMAFAMFMDLRYKGQSYELTLPLSDRSLEAADLQDAAECFHRLHRLHYGYCREEAPVEVVTLRLVATGALPGMKTRTRTRDGNPEVLDARRLYLSGTYREVPVYAREQLGEGAEIRGPAVVTQADSTTLIWPGDRAYSDHWGNLIVETGVS